MLRVILTVSLAVFVSAEVGRVKAVLENTDDLVHNESPSVPFATDKLTRQIFIDVKLVPNHDAIPIDGNVLVSNSVRFNTYHRDVKLTLFPTIDLPDLVITNIVNIHVGKNLCIMGSLAPIFDYGRPELQFPGKALSVQFELGPVMNTGKGDGDHDNVLVIEYEVEVAKPIGDDAGHVHTYGVSVEADRVVKMFYREATFVAGSVASKPTNPRNPSVFVKESPSIDQGNKDDDAEAKVAHQGKTDIVLEHLSPAENNEAQITDKNVNVEEMNAANKDTTVPETADPGQEKHVADGQGMNSLPVKTVAPVQESTIEGTKGSCGEDGGHGEVWSESNGYCSQPPE